MPVSVETYKSGDAFADLLNNLRADLLEQHCVFGALFVGKPAPGGVNFGLFLADNMPQSARQTLLQHLKRTVEEALKRFQL